VSNKLAVRLWIRRLAALPELANHADARPRQLGPHSRRVDPREQRRRQPERVGSGSLPTVPSPHASDRYPIQKRPSSKRAVQQSDKSTHGYPLPLGASADFFALRSSRDLPCGQGPGFGRVGDRGRGLTAGTPQRRGTADGRHWGERVAGEGVGDVERNTVSAHDVGEGRVEADGGDQSGSTAIPTSRIRPGDR
jgi:hypothetical protein